MLIVHHRSRNAQAVPMLCLVGSVYVYVLLTTSGPSQVKTIIGFGSTKQDTHGVHGSPLGAEDLKHVKRYFGFNPGALHSVIVSERRERGLM
jgi:hypothetical protein